MKRPRRSCFLSFSLPLALPCENTVRRLLTVYKPGSGLLPDTISTTAFILDFLVSRTVRKNVCHLSHSMVFLLQQAKLTKTPTYPWFGYIGQTIPINGRISEFYLFLWNWEKTHNPKTSTLKDPGEWRRCASLRKVWETPPPPKSLAGLTGEGLFLKQPVSKDWGNDRFYKCEDTSNAELPKDQGNMTPFKEKNKAAVPDLKEMKICMSDKELQNRYLKKLSEL